MQHLYISYPPDDYEFAHRLVDDLQAASYTVFVDAVSEPGSVSWAAETRRAIRSSGAMIMILPLANRRRPGIRHEGILANRRDKPIYVLARSPGVLPRYLANATLIDFCGDYDPALVHLLDVLPSAASLLAAPDPQRQPMRPPRPIEQARLRRRLARRVMLLAVCGLLIALAVVLGVIPV